MGSMRLFFSISLFCIASSSILKFRPSNDVQDLYDYLMKPSVPSRNRNPEYYKQFGLEVPTQLKAFSYTNCGNPATELAVLTALTVSPDPIALPGTVTIGFGVNIRKTFDSPLQMSVKIEKSVFGTYITIPCVENFGSCDYSDFCAILAGVQCPGEFVDKGIPCKCPFTNGNYTLPGISFPVDVPFLPSGDYRASANMTYNGLNVGCYQIMATFA
ncbi:ganglioside GM2 activator [Patella vulgata]|uniref:ganglioside GM2 activator n=1 Tax=Patella vulgata TaxID=6465 RepID=UPI0021804439|nr:ganglioside GM2 activator [Patella vulgata]